MPQGALRLEISQPSECFDHRGSQIGVRPFDGPQQHWDNFAIQPSQRVKQQLALGFVSRSIQSRNQPRGGVAAGVTKLQDRDLSFGSGPAELSDQFIDANRVGRSFSEGGVDSVEQRDRIRLQAFVVRQSQEQRRAVLVAQFEQRLFIGIRCDQLLQIKVRQTGTRQVGHQDDRIHQRLRCARLNEQRIVFH